MSLYCRSIHSWVWRVSEWILVLFGAVICVGASIAFASQQSSDLWPTPGLYFLELIFLALLTLMSRVANIGFIKVESSAIDWVVGGVLLAFVILGAFTIGPFLFPAILAFWLAATIGDIRQKHPVFSHLALSLVAAVSQAALMGMFLLLSKISIG